MNNSALDQHIQEKFSNYSPEVPLHIWENIISEKDKRKPIAFWLSTFNKKYILVFLVLIITASGLVIYETVVTHGNDSKIILTKKNMSSVSSNNQKKSIPVPDDNLPGKGQNEFYSNTISSNKLNSVDTTSSDIGLNNFTASSSKNNYKNSLPLPNNNLNSSIASSNKKKYNQNGSSSISILTPEVSSDEEINSNEHDLFLNRFLLDPQQRLNNMNLLNTITKINHPVLNIPCPEAEKNAAGNKRYIELYAGPDYAFRSITDTGNSVYLQKRKESTSFSSAFSAGIRYTKVFSNGMSFRTGINYSQINEKFKFAEGNVIQVVYIISSNGDTTGSYTSTGTRYKTTYNKFRTLDIPILIGYELGNGKLHANFNAGVIVNAYSWQKGDVLDTAFQPINITTGKTSSPYQFKTNVGIGFMGGVSVYYKLNDTWHIFAEPYFRYNFSPASKADLTLKQKYNTAGIRFGVRFDF